MYKKYFLPLVIIIVVLLGAAAGLIERRKALDGGYSYDGRTNTDTSTFDPGTGQPPQAGAPGVPQLFISGGKDGYASGGVIALASTQEPWVQLNSYSVFGNAKIDVFEVDEAALLNFVVHDKDNKQVTKTSTKNMRLIKSFYQEVVKDETSPKKINLPIGESGIYYLRITIGDTSDQAFVVRSTTGAVVKEGKNEFVFWAQNFKTGRSQLEGSVRVYSALDKITELANVPMGNDGIAVAPFSETADFAIVQSGSDRAIVPINLQYLNTGYSGYKPFQAQQLSSRFYLFTDRPIYRPGDTVYFKSIMRDDNDGSYSIPQGTLEAKIFRDFNENESVFQKSYSISKDGTIDGQFVLPDDTATGNYQIKITKPGQNRMFDWINSSYLSFKVEYFRKPEYTLDLSIGNQELVQGEKVPFTLKADYFSGQPVAKGQVKYTIFASDFYDYSYYAESYALDGDYRYGYWDGSQVSEETVTLNEQGKAVVELDTAKIASGPKSKVLSIEAEILDDSGNPSFVRKNVIVYSGGYGIYSKDYYSSTQVGGKLNLPIVLSSHRSGAIDNVELKARVSRQQWVMKPGVPYATWEEQNESLPEMKATTDASGEAVFSLTAKKAGSYKWLVEGKDGKGNAISKEFYSWVSDDNEPFYYGFNDGGSGNLTLKTDKDLYTPGQTAKLYVSSAVADRDVFVSFQRDMVHSYRVVKMTGKVTAVDVPVTDADIPNMIASASGFSASTFDTATTNIKVSTDSKKLKVTLTPDRTNVGPGDSVTVNVETKDAAGNGVSADLAVWTIDKALLELASSESGEIFDSYWRERYDNTAQNNSLAGIMTQGGAEKGGCFTGDTQITMADGSTRAIKDIRVGDIVLSRKDGSTATVPGKVTATHSAEVAGYLIINGDLEVTENHLVFVNGTWKQAGSIQIGDALTNTRGRTVTVETVEWQGGKTIVYNFTVDEYHTYFAGGYFVHNQKGGGAGRSVFKDTAYWNPSVTTDSNGFAKIRFKLPDNLTTWVISAVGATNATLVGQTEKEIVVSKDVIVRPILPNILRQGDELVVSALVQNFTNNDHNFETSLSFDAGEVIALEKTNPIGIKAKDMTQVYWKIKPTKETDAGKLTFSTKATDDTKFSDTITQTLPVKTLGFFETSTDTSNGPKTFKLSLAPDTDQDNTTVTLSFSPTLLGSLPNAMKYLVDYPYGCVEQTTSRFVPAVIARENPQLFANALAGKNIDAIIKQGIKQLTELQQGPGGWLWWHEGDSDPFITAYVTEYLLKAKELGYAVDQSVVDRTRNFLEQDRPRMMHEYTARDINSSVDFVAKTYALSLLGSEKGKVKITDYSNLSPDIVAMAVLTNLKNGYTEEANKGLGLLRTSGKQQGDTLFWDAGRGIYFGTEDASTAWVIRALLTTGKDQEMVAKAARYLVMHKRSEFWSNTFATAQVIRAVTDMTRRISESTPNYSYTVTLDGKQLKSGAINSPTDNVTVSVPANTIKAAGSDLVLAQSGDGTMFGTVITKQLRTDKKAAYSAHGMQITREYINKTNPGKPIQVGDIVTISLTLNTAIADNYGVIEDELPAGLIPINRNLKNEQYTEGNNEPYYYWYYGRGQQVTENGMIMSLYFVPSGSQNYRYEARAVSAGKFNVPPVQASLMYSLDVYGRSSLGQLAIIDTMQGGSHETFEIDPVSDATAPGLNSDGTIKENLSKEKLALAVGIPLLLIIVLLVVLRKKAPKAGDDFKSKDTDKE